MEVLVKRQNYHQERIFRICIFNLFKCWKINLNSIWVQTTQYKYIYTKIGLSIVTNSLFILLCKSLQRLFCSLDIFFRVILISSMVYNFCISNLVSVSPHLNLKSMKFLVESRFKRVNIPRVHTWYAGSVSRNLTWFASWVRNNDVGQGLTA